MQHLAIALLALTLASGTVGAQEAPSRGLVGMIIDRLSGGGAAGAPAPAATPAEVSPDQTVAAPAAYSRRRHHASHTRRHRRVARATGTAPAPDRAGFDASPQVAVFSSCLTRYAARHPGPADAVMAAAARTQCARPFERMAAALSLETSDTDAETRLKSLISDVFTPAVERAQAKG